MDFYPLLKKNQSLLFMKKLFTLLTASALFLWGCSSTKNSSDDLAVNRPIEAKIDLTKIEKDRLLVSIDPGRFTQDTLVYRLPRVVQGTYAVSDFGSYVDSFYVYDYSGNRLAHKKTDANSWTIYKGTEVDRIEYWVNDTFDVEGTVPNSPFSPSGTNIEERNVVLNLHGFVGYFDALKKNAYQLTIISPADFKSSAALPVQNESIDQETGNRKTVYVADRYFDITDNPMMYGDLDITQFELDDIEIVLSVFSPNKVHSAEDLKPTMIKMMKAQKKYLGEVNSTKRYDIYLFLAGPNPEAPTGFGALEHHTSTVVVFPESMTKAALEENMIDVVSHEFFHILTPLSVHSEDVHYFDYDQPTFSKHLWMYEGLTEYFATHFQVYEGLVSEDDFYKKISEKIATASTLNDQMSFTEMSENILEQPYASNYFNVYQKGALIGMCLDILIREESGGQRGILSVMKELAQKYGVDKPFVDDKIIDEIVEMTYPSVADFFETHVIGSTPIDYDQFFEKVGLGVNEAMVETNYIQNNGALILQGSKENGTIFFNPGVANNSYWREQGVKAEDVLVEVNGVKVTLENANQVAGTMYSWKPGEEVKVVLDRAGEEIIIEGKLTPSMTQGEKLGRNPDMSQVQKALLEAWLGL